jgi:hypothetical protein
MGLFKLLCAPITAPLHSALWVAEKIHEAAFDALHDPAEIRRTLSSLEKQLLAGEISEEAYEEAELVLLQRLQAPRTA